MLFICCRRISSRWFFPSSVTIVETSRFTREKLELLLHHREDERDALLRVERGKYALFVGDGDVVDRQIRRDEIREGARLADVLEDAGRLFREVRHELEQLTRVSREAAAPSLSSSASRSRSSQSGFTLSAHVRLEPDLAGELEPRQTVEHDGVIRHAEANDFHDAGNSSHVVDVFEAWLIDVRIALADDADDGAVLA